MSRFIGRVSLAFEVVRVVLKHLRPRFLLKDRSAQV